jgi:hypothetical protein
VPSLTIIEKFQDICPAGSVKIIRRYILQAVRPLVNAREDAKIEREIKEQGENERRNFIEYF